MSSYNFANRTCTRLGLETNLGQLKVPSPSPSGVARLVPQCKDAEVDESDKFSLRLVVIRRTSLSGHEFEVNKPTNPQLQR